MLKDGQQLQGSLLNRSLEFRTCYSKVILEKAWLAELNLSDEKGGLHSMVTLNSDRLTGLLEEKVLAFRSSSGDQMELRRERVGRISFPRPPVRNASAGSRGRWVELRNGDRLWADFVSDKLSLVTGSGPLEMKTAELSDLAFSASNGCVAILTFNDRRSIQASLNCEDIEFCLALGPRMLIHQQSVLKVGHLADVASRDVPGRDAQSEAPTQVNPEGFVWIPPGELLMGSPPEQAGRDPDEGPQTRVVIPNGFWIGKCEVTQAEFQQVMGLNPSNATGEPTRPVEKVTWYESVEYCHKLTQAEAARGRLPQGYMYRLPTEAEWEYACRAGTSTRFSYGDDKNETELTNYGWFARNSESATHPVGTRRANPWGLHDMHGNVWEWCLDRWEGKLPGGVVTNMPLSAQGNLRTARGGSWLYEAKACRSANRDDYNPGNRCSDLGFRVVLAPKSP